MPVFRRPLLVLVVLLAVWLLLPPILSRLFRQTVFEALGPSLKLASYTRDLQGFWAQRTTSRTELVAAGRDLVRYAAALEHSLAKDDLIRAELSRMEALLRLPPRAGFRYEVARVERRDLAAWWQQVVIRKGSNYGIEVGSPVVYAGGAAGRVREVGAYSSVVELISSPELRVAAVIEGDTRPIQYQGVPAGAFSPAAGRIAFVPLDFRLEPGKPARVITSGLGGSFPEGLVIGTVSQLELSPDGLFQQGEVRIDPAIASLQEVSVIMREQGPGN